MPSMFNARDAGNYERLMGRWSRRLAPLFIEHAGIADGEEVIEIGCGTGSLTFVLAEAAAFKSLTAGDHSPIYLAAAKAKSHDARIRLGQGDGCALGFRAPPALIIENGFDIAHFRPVHDVNIDASSTRAQPDGSLLLTGKLLVGDSNPGPVGGNASRRTDTKRAQTGLTLALRAFSP